MASETERCAFGENAKKLDLVVANPGVRRPVTLPRPHEKVRLCYKLRNFLTMFCEDFRLPTP
jgi:hypothetical protein